MELSEETKKAIERNVGLPFEKIIQMDIPEEIAYVEKKTGKKLSWREGLRVDGLPIITRKEVDRRIDKIIKESER